MKKPILKTTLLLCAIFQFQVFSQEIDSKSSMQENLIALKMPTIMANKTLTAANLEKEFEFFLRDMAVIDTLLAEYVSVTAKLPEDQIPQYNVGYLARHNGKIVHFERAEFIEMRKDTIDGKEFAVFSIRTLSISDFQAIEKHSKSKKIKRASFLGLVMEKTILNVSSIYLHCYEYPSSDRNRLSPQNFYHIKAKVSGIFPNGHIDVQFIK